VLLHPAPGMASEHDVVQAERSQNRLFELVDSALVEKTMGFRESIVALAIAALLRQHVTARNLGVVSGPDGMIRLGAGLVRIPDVAFISWSRLPGGRIPQEAIAAVVPDLVIEIVSRSNSAAELQRKRSDYFTAGVAELWEIDIDARQAILYRSETERQVVSRGAALESSATLPGFSVPLDEVLSELDRQQ
jgi:Uma2 family endonuclease